MTGSAFEIAQLAQAIERVVMVGTVTEIDAPAARVRVSLGTDAVSDWLPFVQFGSATVRVWIPPVVGSQVTVFSPGGDTTRGLVFPGPFDGSAPDDRTEAVRISMPGVDLELVGGVLRVLAGSIDVPNGDVVASGVSLVNHTHGGIKPGPGSTAVPN
jgi:phage baseplate assembly protein gpV